MLRLLQRHGHPPLNHLSIETCSDILLKLLESLVAGWWVLSPSITVEFSRREHLVHRLTVCLSTVTFVEWRQQANVQH